MRSGFTPNPVLQTVTPRHAHKKKLRQVLALERDMAALSDQELRERSDSLRDRLRRRLVTIDAIGPEALAVAREAAKRVTGLFAYEEQMAGALILADGAIAELATGEGKTLVAALAAYVWALEGRGVHVATVNTYLAERDYEFAKPVFESLGLTIGLLPEKGGNPPKREAYACDATYGVGYEFGFDYLRDQLSRMRSPQFGPTQRLCELMRGEKTFAPDLVQRQLAYAIVDEVDSVLIDEAGSPLVISESAPASEEDNAPYRLAHQMAESLTFDVDYNFEVSKRRPTLTETGLNRIHDSEEIPWKKLRRPWQNYIVNALAAIHGFHRDEHYVVRDDKVIIVDEFTGRAHEERSWNGGLHQAVNAREGVAIQPELESSASITRQRYYALYEKISGLTGTAQEGAAEFREFFGLDVVPVPLHRPSQRVVMPDRAFGSRESALDAVVEEIRDRHQKGQPVLVGTRTIRISDELSAKLKAMGLPHRLLTAKEDEKENEIVAAAGGKGKILIATNMAGRGTHISLTEETMELGGLHVIGVERNESVRIDRQLIGRCARQGQPGSAQFFISADDAMAPAFRKGWGDESGEIKPAAPATKKLLKAQAKIEKKAYEQRQLATERDQWIDQTRNILA